MTFAVLLLATTTSGFEFGDLLPIGGIFGALAMIAVALIKARSSDRETVIRSQQQHMDRLTRERNDAVGERDELYGINERLRTAREEEHATRLETEQQLRTALENTVQLRTQIGELTSEVARLRNEVAGLTDVLNAPHAPGEVPARHREC